MYRDPDENYYRDQYWHWIARALAPIQEKPGALGLDLGCGQGRLTSLLARALRDGKVIGTDTSEPAVIAARKYAAESGLANIEYRVCPIRQALRDCATGSVDVVMMTEVTFFYPHWRADLDDIRRVLKAGGVACISMRPQYFDALCVTRERLLERVSMLLDYRQGNLYGGNVEFTWQTSSEAVRLLREDLGLEMVSLAGIGCCSGTGGDPHASIARPSLLGEAEKRDLMRLELAMGMELPDAGRYMLAIGRKPG
jgi:SAM-dependent methyltransferase